MQSRLAQPTDPEAKRARNKKIIALKKAIVATFDDGRWRELGYLTDTVERIEKHPRLLRSLGWGDNDYEGNVLAMIPVVLGADDQNLKIVEDFVGLEPWLREHDPPLYAELYGHTLVPLEEVESASTVLDTAELNRHAARIRNAIRDDPEQAIGSAKELLETVLKTIIEDHSTKPVDDIPTLLKKAQQRLGLDPKSLSEPGADTLRRTLSNLGQVVVGVAELRTLYGTGHGRSKTPTLEIAHARLVVNAAVSVATFLVEIWQEETRRDSI